VAHIINLLDLTPLEKSAIYNLKSIELWHTFFETVKLGRLDLFVHFAEIKKTRQD
jgi:hypothetical protein